MSIVYSKTVEMYIREGVLSGTLRLQPETTVHGAKNEPKYYRLITVYDPDSIGVDVGASVRMEMGARVGVGVSVAVGSSVDVT